MEGKEKKIIMRRKQSGAPYETILHAKGLSLWRSSASVIMSRMPDDLEQRKVQHLDLAMKPEVEPGNDALFNCVSLIHCALPELSLSEIDLGAKLCGITLRAPLMIVGMTGGTERAAAINRELAQLAEEEGIAFGVGSMRAVLREPSSLKTFAVSPARPPLVMANLGAQQLVETPDAAKKLIELLGADGICIHLNPGQELVQSEGDRDFRGCLDAIGKLAEALGDKLIVKETGCGISPAVAKQLASRGVRNLDVSGAGGTSWTRVEQMRAKAPRAERLGALLSEWGIPTAAAVGAVSELFELRPPGARMGYSAQAPGPKSPSDKMTILASGGVRSGLDAARAIALGADVVGFALPMLRAHQTGGIDAAREVLQSFIEALRAICLLTGSKDLAALRTAPRIMKEPLTGWLRQLGTR